MPNSCAKLLADKQLTVIFIESATAGYLAHRFSLTPYSGDVLMGSLVCYDVRIKQSMLNIVKTELYQATFNTILKRIKLA